MFKSILYTSNNCRIFSVLLLAIFVISGCSKQESENHLARVNNEYLNKEQLNLASTSILSNEEPDREIRELAENWIVTELLYQEGLRHKLDKNPDIKNQVVQYQKQLIANQYLQYEIGDEITAGDEEINEYYFNNRDQFQVSETTHKINVYSFSKVSEAETAQRTLIRRNPEQVQDLKKTYLAETRLVKKGSVISEIRDLLFSGTPPRVSEPFLHSGQYHLFEIIETFPPNAYLPISDVREEIRKEIGIMKYNEAYNALIKKLRKQSNVKTYF